MPYSYDRTAARQTPASEYVKDLQDNTAAFLADRVSYKAFSAKNDEIWGEVEGRGKAFKKEVSDLLRKALHL